MTREDALEWLHMDPSPGLFTQLCLNMGVRDVQVEPILSIKSNFLCDQRPVYGIIVFLQQSSTGTPTPSGKDELVTPNEHMYFANQVVNNAYAMHGLLSILLNCDMIKIGSTLTEFKDFTRDFPSTVKGLSLSNSRALRESHNYVARSWPKQPNKKSTYQYISYIPFEGYLWEIDGLKSGPSRLGPCTEANWLDRLQLELLRKTDRYQKQNTSYSMWSVIEDRRNVLQRKLVVKSDKTNKIETQLDDYFPEWRLMADVQKWEEEYQYAMLNKHNILGLDVATRMTRQYHSTDADVSDTQCYQHDQFNFREQMDTWLQTKDEILRIYNDLGKEEEKHQHYQCDTIRRQHDYDPFITAYLEALQSHGLLHQIITGST